MHMKIAVDGCWFSHLDVGDMFLFEDSQVVWVKGYSESHMLNNPDRKVRNCECKVIPLK